MPLERGGRADKAGNRYEIRCIIYELLKLINEKNYSVVIEAIGDDEQGTDILVTKIDGTKEHQQCKVRNSSKESWEMSDLKSRKIIQNWKYHLSRDKDRKVALVSPIGCSYLVDLHDRAMNTNGNPTDFYEYQILESGKELNKFFETLRILMGWNMSNIQDVLKCIDFLKRMEIKQMSEYAMLESILQRIEFYFRTEKNIVYNALVTLVVDCDIWGKEITITVLEEYLKKQNIEMRMLDGDNRIRPQIVALNQKYRLNYNTLKEGLIQRTEFTECINAIENNQNLIISGNAGVGKSGCAEGILDYCESKSIPHLAIKLDRNIPKDDCEKWGNFLGFPCSVSYALDVISKNEKAVLLLDQLDALRWTQANSSAALDICIELIKQINYLNKERSHNIIIVFVCRSYDLNNDNNIKALFKEKTDSKQMVWRKVIVGNFSETVVEKILGDMHKKITDKTKQLLCVPSNLYIWEHLEGKDRYEDYTTTSHLIEKWYQQLCKKSLLVGVDEKIVNDTKDKIVIMLDKIGRIYAPKNILNVEERGLDYLISAEMVHVDGNKVGFVHQSILDYFISSRMTQQYFECQDIEVVVGEKRRQTPSKRYQVQMFLQNLLEFNSNDFILAGEKMLTSANIRYYIKYVFYEILGQISKPDDSIKDYIIETCENDAVFSNVIWGNRAYITMLRDSGVLEKWFQSEKHKNKVFRMLKSISSTLELKDIEFIKKHAFENEADDVQFSGCFLHDIIQESDELFELRMQFYKLYPEWSQSLYIDLKSMMKNCETRTIRLLAFWLENKIKNKGRSIYHYEEDLITEEHDFLVKNGKYVLDKLLRYIPQDDSSEMGYSDWSNNHFMKSSIERAVVELIKKANIAIIKQEPESFWEYYQSFMGKGYAIYNEIILHGMRYLPLSFSNQIIAYLIDDIDKNVFDYTSGNGNQLSLASEVISTHIKTCNDCWLRTCEETLIRYISPSARDWYKRRIEVNKEKIYTRVYWSFWGDLQYQLLKCIPNEKRSCKGNELMKVLERKFNGKSYRYTNGNSFSGSVHSPVSGKDLGVNQWRQIITNKKIKTRKHSGWKETKNGLVESSIEAYSSDFSSAAREKPEIMIRLILDNKEGVISDFIESLYSGVAFSEHIHDVNKEILEELFRTYPCDLEGQRAVYFFEIIEKVKIYDWSSDITEQMKNIAFNFREELKESNEDNDSEKLYSRALNCVQGHAMRAVGNLLWNSESIFGEFEDVIDKLVSDDDPAIRMATFYALWPIHNFNKEWAEKRIIQIYESDFRIAAFNDSKNMFFRLYQCYKDRVLKIIKDIFNSDDKRLTKIGAYTLCEFYIRYDEFENIIFNVEEFDEEQIKAILRMAVNYLEQGECREKAKNLIIKYKSLEIDVEYPLSRMFYDKLVDIKSDAEFLNELMKAKVGRKTVHAFVRFLEKSEGTIKDYAEIILTLCRNVLEMNVEEIEKHLGIEDEISKLIVTLYDECSNSEKASEIKIAESCLELWDVMFEKQIGQIRKLSRELMER